MTSSDSNRMLARDVESRHARPLAVDDQVVDAEVLAIGPELLVALLVYFVLRVSQSDGRASWASGGQAAMVAAEEVIADV